MATKLQDLAGLFRNTRTRIVILFTVAALLLGLGIGLFKLFRSSNLRSAETDASVPSSPNIQSVPGGFGTNNATSQEYIRLQEQQNVAQAKIAEREGMSAIPTVISATNFEKSMEPSNKNCCGTCCADNKKKPTFSLQASKLRPGTLIYNAEGKVIGTLGADGKVRNSDGQVIGTIGPDGLVRDSEGNVIGSAGKVAQGAPVYDDQGHLIGYVGADGKVRNSRGQVIGTVGPDGIVRDANGNIIGRARSAELLKGSAIPGTPVYDAQGRLIGTVGLGRKVYDGSGHPIGFVASDGSVVDSNGMKLGGIGATIPGTPVYNAQGQLVGTVGPDGLVRDSKGRVIGKLGADGVVRDADGNVIGSTTSPNAAAGAGPLQNAISGQQLTGESIALPGSSAGNPELQQALQRQAAQISAQQAEQLKQQLQGAIAGQANQLLAAWVSPLQQYITGNENKSTGGSGGDQEGGAGSGGPGSGSSSGMPAVKAGTIMYGVLITAVNSDEPGPVLAKIVSGKFKGGRLIGALSNQGQKVMITFNVLNLPDASKTIQINSVAVDQNTERTALSSYTNNHYLFRYGMLLASSFLQGYGQAVSQSGQQITSNGLQTITTNPDLSARQQAIIALGNVGTQLSAQLGNYFNTPPTVHVYAGSPIGVLFLTDVPPLTQ